MSFNTKYLGKQNAVVLNRIVELLRTESYKDYYQLKSQFIKNIC